MVIINLIYPQEWMIMTSSACKSNPLYNYKLFFFRPIFSNNFKYIISQELPSSISIQDTSKWPIIVFMTTGKISFGIPHTFSLFQKLIINLFETLVKVTLPFFLIAISFVIFLFIVFLEDAFIHEEPHVMAVICCHSSLCTSYSSLLTSLQPITTSSVLVGDLHLKESSWSL